ncbi:MAG: MYXO-CTERM sorting domain-containing protein [Myxococcota bacterium]
MSLDVRRCVAETAEVLHAVLTWAWMLAAPVSVSGEASVDAVVQSWSAALPTGVTAQPRSLVRRGGAEIREAQPVAPTGLPIGRPARWLIRDGVVTQTRRAPSLLAAHWVAPTRSPDDVRSLARLAGHRVAVDARVQGRHDPRTGAVRWFVDTGVDPLTLAHPVVWVDDGSGSVHVGPDRTRRVEAQAYPRNPLLDAMPERFDLSTLADPPASLADDRFAAMQCGDPGAPAACALRPIDPSEAGDFVFDAPASDEDHRAQDDPFAAASIFVHTDRWAAFAAEHGLPLPPCVQDGEVGQLVANYRGFTGDDVILVPNAGYTGDCSILTFYGQGREADWGYDADVVLHEMTHGTVDAQMGADRVLGVRRQRADGVVEDAGALNESVADFVAAVISGDPDHAEYVRAYEGGTMRSAANDRRCPEALVGQLHFDAEPMTGALWEAHLELGDDLVTPIIDALLLLDEDATFEEASAAFEATVAAELGDDAAAVLRAALQRHNLLDCTRAADAEAFEGPLWLWPPFGSGGRYEPMRPPALQLRFDVPEDANRLTVTYEVFVTPQAGWEPVGDVHVLVREGEPTAFSYAVGDDGRTLVDAAPDQHLPSVNDGRFELDVTPGAPVYVAFFNQGLHLTRVFDIEASYDAVPDDPSGSTGPDEATGGEMTGGIEPEPDAPADAALDDDGGCSVQPGYGGSQPVLALMLLAWAGLRRRHVASKV